MTTIKQLIHDDSINYYEIVIPKADDTYIILNITDDFKKELLLENPINTTIYNPSKFQHSDIIFLYKRSIIKGNDVYFHEVSNIKPSKIYTNY